MRIITNQFFNQDDYDNLFRKNEVDSDFLNFLDDPEKIKTALSRRDQHFFNCLRFLQDSNRLEIIPVKYNYGLAHMKSYIFKDVDNNILCTTGSINFTYSGIVTNSESMIVFANWEGKSDLARINESVSIFNQIYSRSLNGYEYLDFTKLEIAIEEIGESKRYEELILESKDLIQNLPEKIKTKIEKIKNKREEIFSAILRSIKTEPRLPNRFVPRSYQVRAYDEWRGNDRKGIFNMATGTGKTLTSLNIVYEEFLRNKCINLFIIVPTGILLDQWVEECKSFNLINIITSKSKRYPEDLSRLSSRLDENGYSRNFVFVTTYANFSRQRFQQLFANLNFPELTCIFDECHNIGSRSMLKVLPVNIKYRIGLSATPQRMFDDYGNNKMYDYFNSYPDCFTFTFGMLQAIENKMLCPYYYYPILVYLDDDELRRYKEFTPRLMAHFDSRTNKFDEEGERLLMLRKQIIHKAVNKVKELVNLVSKLDDMKYTFIYAPEGNFISMDQDEFEEENEDLRIIGEYTTAINDLGFRARSLTGVSSDRDNSLKNFQEGRLDILVAMKVLDEGVNIPITRRAIFCSSTGNPRQFIQRRGRVLRTHNDSNKTHADIYDLIVLPYDPEIHNEEIIPMEKRIIQSEIIRAADFAYAALNKEELMQSDLAKICDIFDINLEDLILEKLRKEKLCNYEA